MAQSDARERFHFHVTQGRLLYLREISHLLLRKRDVLDRLGVELVIAGLDLLRAEPEGWRAPLVEPFRQLAKGCIPSSLNVLQDAFDR